MGTRLRLCVKYFEMHRSLLDSFSSSCPMQQDVLVIRKRQFELTAEKLLSLPRRLRLSRPTFTGREALFLHLTNLALIHIEVKFALIIICARSDSLLTFLDFLCSFTHLTASDYQLGTSFDKINSPVEPAG